jgi:8-oxo-dGTP pyrophosphatase MutT (NUDIX family)
MSETTAETPEPEAQAARDAEAAGDGAGGAKRPVPRPRDAGTLVLVRRDGAAPRILMGQRHAGHVFMPNKFVFPGGRVDYGDNRVPVAGELRPEVARRLRQGCSPTKARALALAAIRETFEEAGLLVGARAETGLRTRSKIWRDFFGQGVMPRLDILDFVARAITPPFRPRRFDARFFMVDASHIQSELHESPTGSGELLQLHWVPLDEARRLDLPAITHYVIEEVEARLRMDPEAAAARPVPFHHFRRGERLRELL